MVNGIQILCCGGLSLLAFVLLLFKLDRNTIGKKKERERKNSFLSSAKRLARKNWTS